MAFPPHSTDLFSRTGTTALLLFFSTIAWPSHSLGQSLGTLPVGTPVRVELHPDTTARLSAGNDRILQSSGSRVVEGTFLGFYGDHIRIRDPESGETVVLNLGEMKELWATTGTKVRTRAARGMVIGTLLSGAIWLMVLRNNSSTGSGSSRGSSGSTGESPLSTMLGGGVGAAVAAGTVGSIVVGGLIGAIVGSQVKVEQDGTVLIPLAGRSGPALPNVRLTFGFSNR